MNHVNNGRTLLACLQAPNTPGWLADLTPAEWETLVQQALAQDVAPLLYRRVAGLAKQGHAPPAVAENLRLFYMQGVQKNALLFRELAEVLRALSARGLPAVALKGIHLAELIYPSRTLRPMADIDLLLKQGDLLKADELLQGLGYARPEPFQFDFARDQHWPSLLRPGGVPVEIHWTIMPPAGGVKLDLEGLWQRAQPAVIAGVETLVLCPEDLLLYLCMHAALHHRFTNGIQPLIDIAEVARHFAGRLDWPALQRRARDWHAARAAHLALCLARELMAADIPPQVLAELEPPGFDARLIAAAQDKMFNRSALLSTNFMQLWQPAATGSKVRTFAAGLFPPRGVMARLYPVGSGGLRLAYAYLLRFKDLLLRYGQAAWRQWRRDRGMASQIERDSVLRQRDAALRDWLASE